MGKFETNVIIIFVFLVELSFVSAINSTSYNISNPTISDGFAGNMSSSDFHNDIILEDVSGNTTSTNYNNYLGFWFGSAGIDTIIPIVTLRSPADGSSYTSSSLSATLAYNVSDANNVTNCTLIVNGVVDTTSWAVNNSNVQLTFSKTFTPGTYNWNVNCSDGAGNVGNSSIWSLIVTAPSTSGDTGGGGGGGGGASAITVPQIIVNPDIIKVSGIVNTIKTREIEVYNDGNSERMIRISSNNHEIIDISEEELNFRLASGERKKIDVRLIAPEEPGAYTGKILISGREVLVLMDISSRELLFDVSIVVPDELKSIKIGDKLESQITLIPMGEQPRLDVTINYNIKDFKGRTFLVESETLLVEEQKSFKKNFATQNLPVGDYVISMEVIYLNGVAVSSSHFEVREGDLVGLISSLQIMVLAGLIILFTIFIILIIRSYKKSKKLNKKRSKINN